MIEAAPAETIRWYQRNKYPLMALARSGPATLVDSPAFRQALASEEEWYATQRHEYQLVCEAWLEQGIQCLMLKTAGNYPSFPYNSDNIDVLIRPECGEAARDILRRLGYVELRNIEEPFKYLFRKFRAGRCVSAIHVHEHVAWEVVFVDQQGLWSRMRPADDDPFVNVPSPEDAILINLAHACYENKELRLNDLIRVRHALHMSGEALDWAYMERVAAGRGWLDGLAFMTLVYASLEMRLFGTRSIAAGQLARFERLISTDHAVCRRLAALRSSPKLDLPLNLSYWFCKRLYYRKILADPARGTAQRWYDVVFTLLAGIQLKSNLRPQPGMVVSLSGTDGSGKTAQARALVNALRVCGLQVDYFWSRGGSSGTVGALNRWRRRLFGPGRHTTPDPDLNTTGDTQRDSITRRRQRLGRPIVRFAWAWLVAADQVATYLLRVHLPALAGRIVIADRYVYDTAVEMDGSLPCAARWSRLAIAAILKATPRPRLAYVLDVPPCIARQRKTDEVWHADMERERDQYRALAQRLRLRLLSTDGEFAQANDRLIQEVMTAYMAGWETPLNALFLSNPSQKNAPDRVWLCRNRPEASGV